MGKLSALFVASVALLASVADARVMYAPVERPARSFRMMRREVPQEHSHDLIVNAIRPIVNENANTLPDVIFSLLGNAAATSGIQGANSKFTDPDCLQQNVADQAITNCKAGKFGGQANQAACIAVAIKFRALERNTGGVGVASNACTTTPTNTELSTIKQHQDPASPNAAANNGDVETAVAVALAKLGFSAADAATGALETTTFAPSGADPTAKGNSCDGPDGNPGGSITATAAGTDPVTGLSFKAGDTLDCITLATIQGAKSKRVAIKSRAELEAAAGGNGGSTAAETTEVAEAATTTTAAAQDAATTTAAAAPAATTGATASVDISEVVALLKKAIDALSAL